MKWRKIFLLLILISFFIGQTAFAEIKTYEGVGEYLMTDETIGFAKKQAELAAQRDVLDQIGVYVRSQATMIDHELAEDEIITVSTGILRVTDTKFSVDEDKDGLLVKAFVIAEIDTEELEKLLSATIVDT